MMVFQVLYLFIAETVNTGLDMAIVYEPLVIRFGKPVPISSNFPLLRTK
jgi:hypothetical protein